MEVSIVHFHFLFRFFYSNTFSAISSQFYSTIGVGEGNDTPKAAYLAEQDYKLNGSRARVNSGEFINPRWVPDEEVAYLYHLCCFIRKGTYYCAG